MFKVIGENTLTGNQWECERDIESSNEALAIRANYARLESDYKINYRVEEQEAVVETYVQLKFSRTEGRSFTTGVSGFGEKQLGQAREMAKGLTRSGVVDFIEVVVEEREGAMTKSSETHKWSKSLGWH